MSVDSFEGGLARFIEGGQWGFIDKTGRVVIEPKFKYCSRFREGRALVRTETGFGYIDTQGRMAVKAEYTGGSPLLAEGLLGVEKGGRWGFVDLNGESRIACRFAEVQSFSGGLAAVKTEGKWGFIDLAGALIIPARFEKVRDFSEGLAPVSLKGTWGYIDKTGNFAIQPQYESAAPFSNGLALVKTKDKEFYVDRSGAVVWTNS